MKQVTATRPRWVAAFTGLLPLFVLAHFAHHLVNALPVPLLPFIRDDFGLDYTRAGLVLSAFNLSYGFSQIPSGWLADRIGPRIMIMLSIGGVAISGLLVGLSPNYLMLIVFLVLMGVLGGGYHPASPTMISAGVERNNLGRAMGLHMIGGSASFFLAPLIAAGIAGALGWRETFIILAVPTILFGILFYWRLGRLVPVKKGTPASHTTPATTVARYSPGSLRRLITVILLSNFTQATVFSMVSFVPLFLVDHFGIGKDLAAIFISVYYSSGLWAGIVGGHLSDRWGRLKVIITVCVIAGPFIYLLGVAPYGLAIGALLIGLGALANINSPVSQAYLIEHTSEHNRSTIIGIYFFGSMEGSGVLTPITGYLIDRFGFSASFAIAGAAVLGATIILALFLKGNRERTTA